MATFEEYWHRFIERLKTNTPLQLTFLAGLLLLISGILNIVMKRGSIFVVATLVMFLVWLITVSIYMYTVLCIQDGKCTVLSYVFSTFWLIGAIFSVVNLIVPEMKEEKKSIAAKASPSPSKKSSKSSRRG